MSKFDDFDDSFDLDDILREVRKEMKSEKDFQKDEPVDEGDFDIDFVKENAEPAPSRRTAQPRPSATPRAQVRSVYDASSDAYGGEEVFDTPLPPRGGQARSERIRYEDYRAWEEKKSRRKKRGVGAPLIILLVILVIGFLVSGYYLGRIAWNYHRDRSAYNDLATEAVTGRIDIVPDTEKEEDTSALRATGAPITVDWDLLRQQNSDVIGWLYCPNTIINYPVVQSMDDSFYLDHGFNKQPNTSGTLFADYNSSAGVQLSNFIIYGHNMKDSSMFGTLTKYTDASYYDENPIFYYLTPNQDYRIELLCAHIVESTRNNFPSHFSSSGEYLSYLNSISSHCFWFRPEAMNTDYQLITLSTCSYTSGYVDPRFLVQGIMIPIE